MRRFPYAVVGFDLDGTLLDTHEDLGMAVNHALELAGRAAVPMERVRSLIGGGGRTMLKRALELDGGVPDDFDALHTALLEYYASHIAVHSRLFPGGEAMLDALARHGVQLAVVTNKLETLARQVLGELGLIDRFYTVIGGDTLGPGRAKPGPDPLIEMVARASVSGPAAYVGDTTYDTRAARAAGLPCVAVRFGFNDLPADQLGADAVIDHFDDLVRVLERLGAR